MNPAAPERVARRSDRAWSPYRRARGRLSRVIEEARCQAEALEERSGMRRRARREADLRTFGLSIEALLSDMAHRAMTCGRDARVYLSLDNRDLKGTPRYRPASVGLGLKQALQLLSAPELGPWLTIHQPLVKGERTSIQAGPRLLQRIEGSSVTLADIYSDSTGEEVILLRKDAEETDRASIWIRPASLSNYEDNETTIRMRNEMREINVALRKVAVEVLSEDGATRECADMACIHLRRIFTAGSFETGGRLWDATGAAFWYPMRNNNVPLNRIQRLRIDGEPAAQVDIHAAALTCLYALARVPLPKGDLYRPPGYSEAHRGDFKLATQCAIFRRRRLHAWPPDEPGALPASEVFAALEKHHAPVAHLFWQGAGHQTQRMESDTLVRVLTRRPDLRALPLHDALIVPESRADTAREAFETAFQEVTGGSCRAAVEFAD